MVRFKNRYITVEVIPDKTQARSFSLNSSSLYKSINSKIEQLYGEFGVAAVRGGLLAKYCNSQTSVVFIRVRHGPHRIVSSTLPLIQEIDKVPVTLHTLYTGASLSQCYKFMREYQRSSLDKLWSTLTPNEKTKMEEVAIL